MALPHSSFSIGLAKEEEEGNFDRDPSARPQGPESNSSRIGGKISRLLQSKGGAESNYGQRTNVQITPTSSDMVIAVLGPTGSGKTYFISKLAYEEVNIRHGLLSSMINPMQRPCKIYHSSLSQAHEDGIKLSGVVCLRVITNTRMSSPHLKSLKLLKAICGENFYDHIVIATTK
ncbi:hypothetical protein BDZ45DRAFT_742063 [Acephala macrosclerotiorum]|nr:hypothetical protein BDZ45DRAFT_742063 [Acephala macrosclerotiorum]